jgi:protease II
LCTSPYRDKKVVGVFVRFVRRLYLEWRRRVLFAFRKQTYTAHATSNVDFDTDILRYAYQSMATPASIIDFNMKTRKGNP